MTLYTYINQNIDNIRREVHLGIVPTSVLRHWEIYSRYDAMKKMGFTVCDSVQKTGTDARMCESTIYKIIKRMETTI